MYNSINKSPGVLCMRKPNYKEIEDEKRMMKPTAVSIHSFSSELLNGTPRTAFIRSSGSKMIVAGPASRSLHRGGPCYAAVTD